MGLLATKGLTEEVFTGKYIYLDNDFLSALFTDFEALSELLDLTKSGTLLIDPLTRFEFLQTVFLPAQRELKEQFVDNEVFTRAVEHQTVFTQIMENAYTLSYLYGHHNCKGASVIDLFIAGRALLNNPNALVITGNRKDFPDFIFDLIGAFNHSEGGGVRAYSVVTFNNAKYEAAVSSWRGL